MVRSSVCEIDYFEVGQTGPREYALVEKPPYGAQSATQKMVVWKGPEWHKRDGITRTLATRCFAAIDTHYNSLAYTRLEHIKVRTNPVEYTFLLAIILAHMFNVLRDLGSGVITSLNFSALMEDTNQCGSQPNVWFKHYGTPFTPMSGFDGESNGYNFACQPCTYTAQDLINSGRASFFVWYSLVFHLALAAILITSALYVVLYIVKSATVDRGHSTGYVLTVCFGINALRFTFLMGLLVLYIGALPLSTIHVPEFACAAAAEVLLLNCKALGEKSPKGWFSPTTEQLLSDNDSDNRLMCEGLRYVVADRLLCYFLGIGVGLLALLGAAAYLNTKQFSTRASRYIDTQVSWIQRKNAHIQDILGSQPELLPWQPENFDSILLVRVYVQTFHSHWLFTSRWRVFIKVEVPLDSEPHLFRRSSAEPPPRPSGSIANEEPSDGQQSPEEQQQQPVLSRLRRLLRSGCTCLHKSQECVVNKSRCCSCFRQDDTVRELGDVTQKLRETGNDRADLRLLVSLMEELELRLASVSACKRCTTCSSSPLRVVNINAHGLELASTTHKLRRASCTVERLLRP